MKIKRYLILSVTKLFTKTAYEILRGFGARILQTEDGENTATKRLPIATKPAWTSSGSKTTV